MAPVVKLYTSQARAVHLFWEGVDLGVILLGSVAQVEYMVAAVVVE